MQGAVLKIATNGSDFVLLKQFTNSLDGAAPRSGLVLSGSTLYGTTSLGGSSDGGTVFKINTDGSGFAVIKSFPAGSYNRNLPTFGLRGTGPDRIATYEAAPPMGGLTLVENTLFGTTRSGGAAGQGQIFRVDTDGQNYIVIKEFNGSDGAAPTCDLSLSANTFFGTTSLGGSLNTGTVFRIDLDGSNFAVLKNFTGSDTDGAEPYAGLALSGGTLYGTAVRGGNAAYHAGVVFKLDTNGGGFAVLKNFGSSTVLEASGPLGRLALSGNTLFGTAAGEMGLGYSGIFSLNTNGGNYTSVRTFFSNPSTTSPRAGLLVSGSTLYGTTFNSVFKAGLGGSGFTVLRTFVPSSGDAMAPGPVILAGENLYGASISGGASNAGVIFKVHTNGTGYSVLKSFNGAGDGSSPGSRLVASGDTLYGTAKFGGSGQGGTVFSIKTNGTSFAVLHSFGAEGFAPSSPVQADGVLYGAAAAAGVNGNGVIYKVNVNGTGFGILKDFTTAEGAGPASEPALLGGALYGTTTYGGVFGLGNIFKINTNGTGFSVLHSFGADEQFSEPGRVTVSGTTIYAISAGRTNIICRINADGTRYFVITKLSDPRFAGGLLNSSLLISGSTLYGVSGGVPPQPGGVFQLDTNGANAAIIRSFRPPSEGTSPNSDLVLSGNSLYGTTTDGGELGEGAIYRLDLSPRLTITRADAAVELFWPLYAADYFLEQNSDLADTNWTSLTTATPFNDGTNNSVTLPSTEVFGAYRLRK